MTIRTVTTAAVLAMLAPLAAAQAAAEHRHEAEGSSDSVTIEEEECSGGSAARSPRAWQPLLIAPAPPQGGPYTVWIRHRGGPLCLKARTGEGDQVELQWIWDEPKGWTWTKVGSYDRARLVHGLLVIRGQRGDPALDCLVLRPREAEDGQAPAP